MALLLFSQLTRTSELLLVYRREYMRGMDKKAEACNALLWGLREIGANCWGNKANAPTSLLTPMVTLKGSV
jgi:hypothetical protein